MSPPRAKTRGIRSPPEPDLIDDVARGIDRGMDRLGLITFAQNRLAESDEGTVADLVRLGETLRFGSAVPPRHRTATAAQLSPGGEYMRQADQLLDGPPSILIGLAGGMTDLVVRFTNFTIALPEEIAELISALPPLARMLLEASPGERASFAAKFGSQWAMAFKERLDNLIAAYDEAMQAVERGREPEATQIMTVAAIDLATLVRDIADVLKTAGSLARNARQIHRSLGGSPKGAKPGPPHGRGSRKADPTSAGLVPGQGRRGSAGSQKPVPGTRTTKPPRGTPKSAADIAYKTLRNKRDRATWAKFRETMLDLDHPETARRLATLLNHPHTPGNTAELEILKRIVAAPGRTRPGGTPIRFIRQTSKERTPDLDLGDGTFLEVKGLRSPRPVFLPIWLHKRLAREQISQKRPGTIAIFAEHATFTSESHAGWEELLKQVFAGRPTPPGLKRIEIHTQRSEKVLVFTPPWNREP